jgi:agmatinase
MTSQPGATRASGKPFGEPKELSELSARNELPGTWCVFGVPVSYDCRGLETPSAGPAAIRGSIPYFGPLLAGRLRRSFWDWNGQRELDLDALAPADVGDIRYNARTDTAAEIEDRIRGTVDTICRAGGRPLVLGGEHWLTLPVLQALVNWHADLYVIHFDAHTDRYTTGRASSPTLNNSNVMRFAEALPGVRHLLQLGVRELEAGSLVADAPASTRTVSAREVIGRPAAEVFASIPAGSRAYLTIDADVLDPSCAPEVGWPVMGGLSLRELMDLVGYAAREYSLVGADLVEVTAGSGQMNLAAMSLARCALEIVCADASVPRLLAD